MHKTSLPAWLLLITTLLLFSCVPQKKVPSVRKELKTVDSLLTRQQIQLDHLDEQRRVKQEQNEMDDTTSNRINKYINTTIDEIEKMHAKNTILIGETEVNRADWEKLLKTLSASRRASKNIGDKIMFLTDLINQNTVVKIDQDVLFEPGSYTVTPAMAQAIGKLFEPAAVEIDSFTQKYPDFPLSLVITAKGYADATIISPTSALYRDLKEKMSLYGTDPDNKMLNKELSTQRAKEVVNLFKKFAAQRAGNKSYIKNVLYIHEGKGETLPNPKLTDYRADDPRRRVVYLFWSVFPE